MLPVEDFTIKNAAAYMGGFLIMRYKVYHENKFKIPLSDCNECSLLLTDEIIECHTYNTFKDYQKQEGSKPKLNYISETLVNEILKWENIVLHYFDEH